MKQEQLTKYLNCLRNKTSTGEWNDFVSYAKTEITNTETLRSFPSKDGSCLSFVNDSQIIDTSALSEVICEFTSQIALDSILPVELLRCPKA